MSVWNKSIGSNYGGGKQVGTQGSMIGQKRLIFGQISMLGRNQAQHCKDGEMTHL